MEPAVSDQSAVLQLLSVFGAGLGTSLTPCVYPLIPITLALFGATPEAGRWRAFRLAVTYVLGIATTYTALGVFSAKTGAVFGSFLGNPFVVGALAFFLSLLALYSLDLFQLRGVTKLQGVASSIGGTGFRGAFLMGAVSGLVAAPCAGPWLVVVLGIAAASQSTTWGAVLLFTYALGMGLPFIVLGTFPALLRRVPRSGNWLLGAKFLMASALLGVAFILVRPFLPAFLSGERLPFYPVEHFGAFIIGLSGAFLGWFGFWHNRGLLKFSGAAILAWGICTAFIPPPTQTSHQTAGAVQWFSRIEDALSAAKSRQVVAVVDLYADWCSACKELEKLTFPDPAVQRALRQLVTARIDFTVDSPANGALAEQYKVVGLPCILFLDSEGRELPGSRITGFVSASEFVNHLKRVVPQAVAD
jgi:thiol:disulfide interchange protein DsbD